MKCRKTKDMINNNIIRNAKQTIPYCDPNKGVIWGTNKEDGVPKSILSSGKRRTPKSEK